MTYLELFNMYPFSLYLLVGLISLMIGSLLNVVIYRLPIMMQEEWRHQCCELLKIEEQHNEPKINLFLPRSFCPHCKNQISMWQNIPILSYLLLRGRCYYCKTVISLRYPFIELLTMGLSLYASWHIGLSPQLPFVLLAIWLLIPMFFIDLEHQLLPDSLTLSLLWLGLIANSEHLFISLNTSVLSAVGAYLGLWIFVKLFYLITGKIGMGNGDFKLLAALGAWLGWMDLPLILLLSCISGSLIGIIYLHIRQQSKNTPIPFGPFLCISGLIALFWGEEIMSWYLRFF